MKVLIIGLGSIGLKHVRALRNIKPDVEIFALRSGLSSTSIEGIVDLFSLSEVPKNLAFIIISNPTSKHYETIRLVLELRVPLFIEKPPVDKLHNTQELLDEIDRNNIINYTAFNLRFHPIIKWIKLNISKYRVIEVNSYCGSYLPDWRKETDYRKNYSAIREMGGGVHLDLTHEIDYLLWIFGSPNKVISSLSKISDLEINSNDSARYIFKYDRMSIGLTLNYFRRKPRRDLEIVTDQKIFYCNILDNEIWDLTNNLLIEKFDPFDELYTYTEQLKYFIDAIENKKPLMNDLRESLNTMSICLNKL